MMSRIGSFCVNAAEPLSTRSLPFRAAFPDRGQRMSDFGWKADIAHRCCSAQVLVMGMKLPALVALLSVTACENGQRPFRMVQFCLASTAEIEPMKALLREVAATQKLPFFDRSKDTEAELNAIAKDQKDLPVAHPTVNVGTAGAGAVGFCAGNFAEAPSPIVVGFSQASDTAAARQFSDAVVRVLSSRWRVHEVANVEKSGAFPLKDCNR